MTSPESPSFHQDNPLQSEGIARQDTIKKFPRPSHTATTWPSRSSHTATKGPSLSSRSSRRPLPRTANISEIVAIASAVASEALSRATASVESIGRAMVAPDTASIVISAIASTVGDDSSPEQQSSGVYRITNEADARQQVKLNGTDPVVFFVERIKKGINRGHRRLAQKIGIGLYLISLCHIAGFLVVSILYPGAGEDVLTVLLTHACSVVSLLLQILLVLARKRAPIIWLHYVTHSLNAAISSVNNMVGGNTTTALYYLLWVVALFPAGGFMLNRFLKNVRRNIGQGTRDDVARAAIIAFCAAAAPILYFFMNGFSCLLFIDATHCGTRIYVDATSIFALGVNAGVAVMLKLQPLTLKQIINLDIPRSQLIGFIGAGALVMIVLAVHSQNETFQRAPSVVRLMTMLASPCMLVVMVSRLSTPQPCVFVTVVAFSLILSHSPAGVNVAWGSVS